MRSILTVAIAALLTLPAWPQAQPADPAGAADATEHPMAALGFLVGEWRGTGWIRMGPGEPHRFNQRETVETRLDGGVILIEGVGHDPENEDTIVHHAFAVLSYSAAEERYVMRAYRGLGDGQTLMVDAEAEVIDGALVWGYEHPQAGLMRYTIREDEEGRWHETGAMSRDGGETWFPFFEMTLERVE